MIQQTAARGYFVTGTDTGVGKTVVTCMLLRAAARAGLRAAGMKPVAAGMDGTKPGTHSDVEHIIAAMNVEAAPELVNPYLLSEAIAPHLAAKHANITIELQQIRIAYEALTKQADIVFVEGVGGFLVPFGHFDSADIAAVLQLPVILVVGMRLGCLNHALLTAAAIQSRGVAFGGWIANHIEADMQCVEENIAYLTEHLPAPLLGIIPDCAAPYSAAADVNINLGLLAQNQGIARD